MCLVPTNSQCWGPTKMNYLERRPCHIRYRARDPKKVKSEIEFKVKKPYTIPCPGYIITSSTYQLVSNYYPSEMFNKSSYKSQALVSQSYHIYLRWMEKYKYLHRKIFKLQKNFMAPFCGWGSTTWRLEPLQGASLLFTTKFPEIPGTHFIDLGRMKGWVDLGATQRFWTRNGDATVKLLVFHSH